LRLELERSHQNIYGNTGDSNQLWERKVFMSAKLDRFKNIKGFLHPDEGKFLYELSSRECRERFAVEIGSYCGKSACYIGLACKENDTKLFSIDHHRGSEEQQFGEEYFDEEIFDYEKKRVDTYPLFISNIKKFGLIDTVIPVIDNSVEASKKIEDDLDLVFIDGSHTFESARNDYFSWRDKIRIGGILAIHDIYDSELEGGQAPREIYEKALGENFELIDRVHSLVALRKLG
jgi:predicted O-methyltransferase YrrM